MPGRRHCICRSTKPPDGGDGQQQQVSGQNAVPRITAMKRVEIAVVPRIVTTSDAVITWLIMIKSMTTIATRSTGSIGADHAIVTLMIAVAVAQITTHDIATYALATHRYSGSFSDSWFCCS